MRNFKKVLSALLAMVLVFGTMTIGAESAYLAYKDSALDNYDSINKPILSTGQYSSMLLDEVDRMLAKENMLLNLDLAGLIKIELDLRSVDDALNSVVSLWNMVSSMAGTIGGDVQYLNFSAIAGNPGNNIPPCPRRTTPNKTDADILLALFQFLADNAGIIAKLPYGSDPEHGLNLGILAGYVDISEYLDLELLAKEAVAGLVYPDYEDDPEFANFDPKDLTLDEYISEFINLIASGSYDPDKSETINEISDLIQKYVPGFTSQVDLVNDSVYDIIEKCFRMALNSVLVPLANTKIRKALRELCGVVYTKELDEEGDPILDENGDPTYTEDDSHLNEYAELLNIDFELPPFNFEGWGDIHTDSFVNHFNDIFGAIVEEIANPETLIINWDYSIGNDGLLDNIINVAKQVLAVTGNAFFASYVEVIPPEQLDDDDPYVANQKFIAYILRSTLNGSIDDMNIPNTCDSITKVLFEAVKSIAANYVPSQDYSYLLEDYPEPDLYDILDVVADIAVYGLNQVTNMDLDYGISFNDLVNACYNWIETNYGGFVSGISGDDGWERLSSLVFSIFSPTWLPNNQYGVARDNLYDIIYDDILYNLIDLNIPGILSLLQRNDSQNADFNNTIIEVLLGRIVAIINFVIPETFLSNQTPYSLEDLLNPEILSSMIFQLITGLNNRAATIFDSLLPLLCSSMGLSSPQEFGYPYIGIPEALDPAKAATFYMFNGSSGINTAYKDKYNGNTIRDQLYKYRILSVQTNKPGITVSYNTADINGGESRTFTINGTLNNYLNSVLRITITYNVLEENGNVMTPNPLTATVFTYISGEQDDSDYRRPYDLTDENMHLVYATYKYLNQKSKVQDLEDITFTLQRNVSSKATQHVENSTFTLQSSTINPTLANCGVSVTPLAPISTTRSGGAWPYQPYTVAENAMRPANGLYQTTFVFFATKTSVVSEQISFNHFVYFYDDFDLPSIFNSAVRSNRQQSNYDQGEYEVTYKPYYTEEIDNEEEGTVTTTVTGSEVWDYYISSLTEAASIIYRPRQIGSFGSTHASRYEDAAYNLYTAVQQLEGGSLSSGAASVKTALESFVPPCATKLNEEGVEVDVEYYENGYTYFDREDYVGHTYSSFKEEKKSAERLIEKWEDGEDIDTIEAAYVGHRLTLYGNRLIRVRAYTEHLEDLIGPANAVVWDHYSNDAWEDFVNARNFANAVLAEPIGATVNGTEYLVSDGLRQSKVNRARSELIAATKRLVQTVDYEQLSEAVDTARSVYEAGNNPQVYTALSWDAFATAYENAIAVLDAKLTWSVDNQLLVDNACTALNDAFAGLEAEISEEPGIEPIPDVDPLSLIEDTGTVSFLDGLPVNFIYGLDEWNPMLDGKIESKGGAYYEVDKTYNLSGRDGGTGTRVMVYTDSTKQTLIKSYWVVFFGDINGDGRYENSDYEMMYDVENMEYEWGYYTMDDNAFIYACDVNHDGRLDVADRNVLLLCFDVYGEINQSSNSYSDYLTWY